MDWNWTEEDIDGPSTPPRFMRWEEQHQIRYNMAAKDLETSLLNGRASWRSVVAVLGGPAKRKTPLAARIYLSDAVVKYFDIRVWIAVSLDDNVGEILTKILGLEHEWRVEATSRVDAVRKFLRGKRFLIVLDDVLSDKLWNFLRDVLPDDCVGSKVLVTTRSKAVAASFLETTSDQVYEMELGNFTSRGTSRRFTGPVLQAEASLGGVNMTTFRRLDLMIRAKLGLQSTKPKLAHVASTSSSFPSERFSIFSDDIED